MPALCRQRSSLGATPLGVPLQWSAPNSANNKGALAYSHLLQVCFTWKTLGVVHNVSKGGLIGRDQFPVHLSLSFFSFPSISVPTAGFSGQWVTSIGGDWPFLSVEHSYARASVLRFFFSFLFFLGKGIE